MRTLLTVLLSLAAPVLLPAQVRVMVRGGVPRVSSQDSASIASALAKGVASTGQTVVQPIDWDECPTPQPVRARYLMAADRDQRGDTVVIHVALVHVETTAMVLDSVRARMHDDATVVRDSIESLGARLAKRITP